MWYVYSLLTRAGLALIHRHFFVVTLLIFSFFYHSPSVTLSLLVIFDKSTSEAI
jgi:hypothetical protein